MKRVTYEGEIELSGRLLAINTNAQKRQGCFIEILAKMHSQLEAMLSHHSKVFVFMAVFHLDTDSETNQLFSRFMRKLKKRLENRYQVCRVGHVWVRESEPGGKPHYHLALFLDGNTICYPQKVFQLCADIWEGWNQPRPAFTPGRCYYQIRRQDNQIYRTAFQHLSYLAKTRSKGNRPPSTNDYSASRLMPKSK